MVEHPGGEADRRILDRVQRLGTVTHLLGVGQAVLVEEVELIVCVLLVGRKTGRRWAAGPERLRNVVRNGGGHVGVNADQFRRRQEGHLLRDGITPIAALGHVSRVAEALHQHDPGACDANRLPTERGGLA